MNPEQIIDFWFGPPGSLGRDQPRERWFKKDLAFDQAIRDRFAAASARAHAGELDAWLESADGCLALLILLDQFLRNMYRGTPRMYACDDKALAVARHVLERGYDRGVCAVRAWFYYMPFQHSEALADQERSVALFSALPPTGQQDRAGSSAQRHHEIVARFGRFPHRNAVLGRTSSADEVAFLREPNSAF
ncbi:MAG: DUF924 domain-containing protein [Alphaproteobacteria bacterium]|nr:DUF924 domain-containing protein [Alphaproteobacteria bacterium]